MRDSPRIELSHGGNSPRVELGHQDSPRIELGNKG